MPGQNDTSDPNRSGKARTIVTLLVIAGLAWFAFIVVRDLLIYGVYFRYVDEFAEKTGLNQYLINTLAALCLAPFVVGIKYYFFSFPGSKRPSKGAALILGMTAAYNIALYVATKDDAMGKFYAITGEGIRYEDRARSDGREWHKVTRDNIWYVTHLAVGKSVDATGRNWFEQKSGLPLMWYSKLDNQIEFYDGPGFDRYTREELKPVTRELYIEWRRSTQARTPSAATTTQAQPPAIFSEVHPRQAVTGSPTSKLPETAPATLDPVQREAQRVSALELLLNPVPATEGTRLAVVVKSRLASSQLPRLLFSALKQRDSRLVANAIQEAAFIERGYFDEIENGRVTTLTKTSLFRRINYLLIGTVDQQCGKRTSLDADLISCDLDLGIKLIDRNGAVVSSDSLSAVGVGYSEQAALAEGSGRLAGAVQAGILRPIPR